VESAVVPGSPRPEAGNNHTGLNWHSDKMANSVPVASQWQTDSKKCCLCQKDIKEDLKSTPTNYIHEYDGYKMIATNVPLFYALNDLPIVVDLARLDEGGGIEETLRRNKAKYHQSCRLQFNNTKLDRARKRRVDAQSIETAECQTKLRRTSHAGQESKCFLSEKEAPVSDMS